MFEYLMPLLLMRSYPETLLDQSCRMAVRAQIALRRASAACRGASRSRPTTSSTATSNYQYKAFGVPGLGLKRGLGDELVVAPYATALAAMVEPAAAVAQPAAARARRGSRARYGFYEAIDYTHARAGRRASRRRGRRRAATRRRGARLHGPPPGHDPGRARQRAARRARWSSASTPTRACRPPSCCCRSACRARRRSSQPRPAEETRVGAAGARRRAAPLPLAAHARTRTRSSSRNGSYTAVVTNAGGGASFCRGRAVTRCRRGRARATPAASSSTCATCAAARSGRRPTSRLGREPRRATWSTFLPEKAIFRRRDDGIATQLEIAVSPEDDVEVRRLTLTNHSDRPREIEVTSYAEIVLAPAGRRPRPPGVRQAVRRDRVPRRARPRCSSGAGRAPPTSREPGRSTCSASRAGRRGRSSGRPTARASSAAAATPSDPQALDGAPALGHHRRRARPDREPAPAAAPAARRLRAADLHDRRAPTSRDAAVALAQKYHDAGAVARTFALAFAHAQSGLRHLGITQRRGAALRAPGLARALRRRLAARAGRACWRATRSARRGSGRTASPATCRSCWCASSRRTTCRSCARCCRRRSTGASRACAPTS